MTWDVVVLGSANLDLVFSVPTIPAPGETVLSTGRERHPGGKGLNQAVAAARAGARTVLLGAVGDDEAAGLLLTVANAAGVDTAQLRRVPGPSGAALITVAQDGENAIVVDGAANTTMTSLEPTERDTLATGAVLVAQLELPVPVVTEAAAVARAAGSRVVLNAAPVTDLDAGLLALVDLLVVNEHEARALAAGAGDPWEAGRRLLGQVGSVVITLGAAGALLFDERGERPVPGVPATVVDTTGAGDTFTGVLAATLADGASADDAVSRAVVASALSVERAGAVPSIPTAAEVDARLAP